ncbi:MAG: hypothetical protein HY981_00320 [Candidatus Magasanikbacteria bacterium]|nr:hypothetical protein [Candidatus Magasanikbacteria bacterium]
MPERGFNPYTRPEISSDTNTVEIDERAMQENIAAHEHRAASSLPQRVAQHHLTPRARRKADRAKSDADETAQLERATADMLRTTHSFEKDDRFVDTVGAEAAYVDGLWFDSLVDERGHNRALMKRFEVYKEALEKSKDTFVNGIREHGKVLPISGYAPGDMFDAEIARMNRLLQ